MYVLQMRPVEQVRVDQERLGILYDQLGESGAEDVVCRAMEELALRMSHCDRLYQASNWLELRKNCRSLIAIPVVGRRARATKRSKSCARQKPSI